MLLLVFDRERVYPPRYNAPFDASYQAGCPLSGDQITLGADGVTKERIFDGSGNALKEFSSWFVRDAEESWTIGGLISIVIQPSHRMRATAHNPSAVEVKASVRYYSMLIGYGHL